MSIPLRARLLGYLLPKLMRCVCTSTAAATAAQIYALLHRQDVFAPYRQQPRFADLTENIFLVLDYFNAKVGHREKRLCQEVCSARRHAATFA